MAKKSMIVKNEKRKVLVQRYATKRAALKEVVKDVSRPLQDRLEAQAELAALPRNSSAVRVRNRCALTGRARGYFRMFKISRIMLRKLALEGLLPGVKKTSW
jgi:small subunit ribosomal protein S14